MVNTTVTDDVRNVQTEGLEQSDSGVSEKNLPGTNSTVSVKTVHGDAAIGESSNLGAGELEKTYKFVATNKTENKSGNSDGNESYDVFDSDKPEGNTETGQTNENQNTDATEDEMFKGDPQIDETDETLDSSSTNGTPESVDNDDSSDSHIHEDVTEAQTDLDTLPDIRNEDEVDNTDGTAAE
ncbi:PREDICTED: dentin sialophosphoprotein-like [Lupinus angustifolius]|nr:PREDICTED: dentin sialophosphoprotein-like [Lupinus angustifolius]